MADSLSTIGSIATYLFNSFTNVPPAMSGTFVIIADLARQHVANYTGDSIGSNSIADIYQPAIVDFAKADALDLIAADPSNAELSLAELSIGGADEALSAEQFRMLGEMKLRALGRKIQYAKSLS